MGSSDDTRHLRRALVVSDLHLFANRSAGDALFEKWFHDVRSSDVSTLVLNGDTFDFRWSGLESEQAGRRRFYSLKPNVRF
jgi:UDP-2,3-diacylglucosamine pyrophosphatase LpxH